MDQCLKIQLLPESRFTRKERCRCGGVGNPSAVADFCQTRKKDEELWGFSAYNLYRGGAGRGQWNGGRSFRETFHVWAYTCVWLTLLIFTYIQLCIPEWEQRKPLGAKAVRLSPTASCWACVCKNILNIIECIWYFILHDYHKPNIRLLNYYLDISRHLYIVLLHWLKEFISTMKQNYLPIN